MFNSSSIFPIFSFSDCSFFSSTLFLLHRDSIFSCFWEYYSICSFHYYYYFWFFCFGLMFHCWSYPQMSIDPQLSVYHNHETESLAWMGRTCGLLGFILTNNQVESCFYNCSSLWVEWAGWVEALLARSLAGWEGDWRLMFQILTFSQSPVFSVAPHYHLCSPPSPTSHLFGSISPENKPPVFG